MKQSMKRPVGIAVPHEPTVNMKNLTGRVDKLADRNPEEYTDDFWLVRDFDNHPPNVPENTRLMHAPRLEVPCRRMKVREFHLWFDWIVQNGTQIHQPEPVQDPDWSLLPECMKPL